MNKLGETPKEQQHLPANEPTEQPKETSIKQDKHKKIVLATLIVLVLGMSFTIVRSRADNSSASQASNQQQDTTQEIQINNETKVINTTTFEECKDSGGEVESFDETQSCTATDGEVFEESDEEASIANEESPNTGPSTAGAKWLLVTLGPTVEDDVGQVTIGEGKSTKTVKIHLVADNIDRESCTLTIITTPDAPNTNKTTITLPPVAVQEYDFIDGTHNIKASCSDGPIDDQRNEITLLARDGQPEKCKNFDFIAPTTTPATPQALQTAMTGTWKGCVELPWWATYYVTITFNEDGTYTASSTESLDGNISYGGFYQYSIAGTNSKKVFGIDSITGSFGNGFIDLVHQNGSTVWRGDLRNIKLQSNKLIFDFYHRGQYGPLEFSLIKQ